TLTAPAFVGDPSADVTVEVVDATATTVVIGAAFTLPPGGGTVSTSVGGLVAGSNPITVTVTDSGGNQTIRSARVVYDPDAPAVAILSPAAGASFGAGASPILVSARVADLT